jgi:hypothetical protein
MSDDFGLVDHKSPVRFIHYAIYIVIGVFILTIVVIPIGSDPQKFVDNVLEKQKQKDAKTKLIFDTNDQVKISEDCAELSKLSLELISRGANADAWIKSTDDKSLKIAKERSEILC